MEVFASLQCFDFFQLLKWCIEIARGMEFLAISKVVHADLATRNVLLDENFHAKISDFGLSRQLYCYSEYVKKRQVLKKIQRFNTMFYFRKDKILTINS